MKPTSHSISLKTPDVLLPVAGTGNALSRRRFLAVGTLAMASALASVRGYGVAATTDKTATGARNLSAFGNRAPLANVPMRALPLGSVRAQGWLLTQLELQRDGLTGHAEEVLPAVGPDSAWLGGQGEAWEKGPYYLKGLVPLAYTLDDAALKARAQKWIDAILNSQRADGFFGPTSNDDWWPRMVATYVLRDYAEATSDARVVPFLTRYHRHMNDHIAARPLIEWGKARAGDQIDTIFWLYNRTGDAFLLELADKLEKQAYPWRDIFINNRFMEWGEDHMPKHSVNVPQALKMPIVYSQRSNDVGDVAAYPLGVANLNRDHGLSAGINSGTEFLAGRSSTQGIETCSTVERMLSDETAIRISGDARIGDDLETMAFNVLPAALSTAIRQHVYYTLPNNVTAPKSGAGFNQDYDTARTPSPISGFPCCCYNFHMGWPKFAQNSWAATSDGGLAVVAYAPTTVTANVGAETAATAVTWTQKTDYPFDDTVTLTLQTAAPARFPLWLRVPGWCENAEIRVNGQKQPRSEAGTFAILNRQWRNGDVVTARFPMSARILPGVNDSVSVRRGALIYSLKIEENWEIMDAGKKVGFESYRVLPQSPWNYALDIAGENFRFEQNAMQGNPFDPARTPVKMTARARRLDSWTLAPNQVVAYEVPLSPVASTQPLETITLAPFGSQMLRVTNFPVLGAPKAPPTSFRDQFAGGHFDAFVPYGGGWFARDGALHASPNASSFGYGIAGVKCVAYATDFADFDYRAQVSVGPNGNAGLLFRVTKPSMGADAYQGYYVGLSAENDEIQIGRADNNWSQIASAKMNFEVDQTYPMRVEARGANLKVWVGQSATPVLDVSDDTFKSGAIGVRQWGSDANKTRASFAGIQVTAV